MKIITIFYILNATLILLHEIESAYEKEWELFRLPGKITGFVIFHIPIILLLFYGLLEIERQTIIGFLMGLATGTGGLMPFIVHKIVIKREEKFNRLISNVLIYSNFITGVALIILSLSFIT
ncbi:MAG: DUF6713 family protein [bacterium]